MGALQICSKTITLNHLKCRPWPTSWQVGGIACGVSSASASASVQMVFIIIICNIIKQFGLGLHDDAEEMGVWMVDG